MKEKNVFTQWKLARSQRYWRDRQMLEITEAVKDFLPAGDSKEARIFGYAAIYFAHVMKFLEDLMETEMASAVRHLNGLPGLVGEGQFDYALSYSLGVFEASNITGLVAAQLLSKAQRALTHASTLTLGQNEMTGLPMFANDSGEDLVVACTEISPAAISGLAQSTKNCVQLCEKYSERAKNVLEFLTPSISSYVNAVTMDCSAKAFKKTAIMVNNVFSPDGIFEEDPAHNSQEQEVQIARALVAGSVADIINNNIQNGELWQTPSLN